MPAKRYRSRTLRRVFVKTPGGKNVLQYRKRKPSPAACAGCGAVLKGIPRLRPFKMQNTPKTKKRPERAKKKSPEERQTPAAPTHPNPTGSTAEPGKSQRGFGELHSPAESTALYATCQGPRKGRRKTLKRP